MFLRCSEKSIRSERFLVASTSYSIRAAHPVTSSISPRRQHDSPLAAGAPHVKIYKRRLTTLETNERQTLGEIRELKAKLALLDKKKEADEASKNLGELDEETLNTVYEALNFAEPLTPEDVRLETRERQKTLGRRKSDEVFLDTWHGKRTLQRLATLETRLKDLLPLASFDVLTEQGDAYEQVKALLKSTNALVKERSSTSSELKSSKEEGEAVHMQAGEQAAGATVFSSAAARESLLSKLRQLSTNTQGRNMIANEEDFSLPLGVATTQEWEALVIAFAYAGEERKVKQVFETVELCGQGSSLRDLMNAALDVYANKGNIASCQAVVSTMTTKGIFPDDYTRHCLIKSQLVAEQLQRALDMLSDMENNTPASMQTYTLVTEHLLRHSSNPMLQAKAWTLFYRMRLVAHPIPDAPLYALMIKACAMGVPQTNATLWKPKDPVVYGSNDRSLTLSETTKPDTERALDLFREMTSRYNIRPSAEVYTNVILACVKRKDTYEKGFEIFRNMVEMERHRLGGEGEKTAASVTPSRETYNALLQGCAKTGDLLRARWILAEMLRSATLKWKELTSKSERNIAVEEWESREVESMRPNEKTLTSVLYTYASYRPSTSRKSAVTKDTEETNRVSTVGEGTDAVEDTPVFAEHAGEVQDGQQDVEESEPLGSIDEDTLTYQLPATSKAILREASALMQRIKEDYGQQGGLLSSVRPDPQLLHSYIAVISAHGNPAEQSRQIQEIIFSGVDDDNNSSSSSLFEYYGLSLNGFTCEAVLDACSKMQSRSDVIELARRVWDLWISMGGNSHRFRLDERRAGELGIDSRRISSCWACMIRVYAKANDLDAAMGLVGQFAQLYPPAGVETAPSKRPSSPRAESPSSSLSLPPLHPSPPTEHRQGDRVSPALFSKSGGIASTKDSDKMETTLHQPVLLFKPVQILHLRLVEAENRTKELRYLTFLIRMYTKSRIPKMPMSLRGAELNSKQSAMSKIVQQRASSSSYSSFSPPPHLKRSYG